ncbi:MAG: YgjV family protein [Clostridia bacterium]|nr:YgjV family protein [Clostridia bacterium]
MSAATILLIANILSLVGNVIATSAAFLKSKRNILLFQSSNHVLEIIAQTMTEAYSGVTQEVISLVRNVSLVFIKSAKKAPKLIISVVCLVAGLVAGVLFNVYFSNNVLYGYLPVVAGAVYGVFVILAFLLDLDSLNSELLIKIGIIFNAVCWSVYGVFIRLYPVMIFNGVAFVLAAVSIVRIFIAKKKKAQPTEEPSRQTPPDPPTEE